ncbi:SNF2-related N-terminal domain [Trinorchestia longiramus]|nr:SNF2-related N-terminal domain [Trinorchestia longiramus]
MGLEEDAEGKDQVAVIMKGDLFRSAGLKQSEHHDVEGRLYDLLCARTSTKNLSRDEVRELADKVATEVEDEKFEASVCWLDDFMRRFCLSTRKSRAVGKPVAKLKIKGKKGAAAASKSISKPNGTSKSSVTSSKELPEKLEERSQDNCPVVSNEESTKKKTNKNSVETSSTNVVDEISSKNSSKESPSDDEEKCSSPSNAEEKSSNIAVEDTSLKSMSEKNDGTNSEKDSTDKKLEEKCTDQVSEDKSPEKCDEVANEGEDSSKTTGGDVSDDSDDIIDSSLVEEKQQLPKMNGSMKIKGNKEVKVKKSIIGVKIKKSGLKTVKNNDTSIKVSENPKSNDSDLKTNDGGLSSQKGDDFIDEGNSSPEAKEMEKPKTKETSQEDLIDDKITDTLITESEKEADCNEKTTESKDEDVSESEKRVLMAIEDDLPNIELDTSDVDVPVVMDGSDSEVAVLPDSFDKDFAAAGDGTITLDSSHDDFGLSLAVAAIAGSLCEDKPLEKPLIRLRNISDLLCTPEKMSDVEVDSIVEKKEPPRSTLMSLFRTKGKEDSNSSTATEARPGTAALKDETVSKASDETNANKTSSSKEKSGDRDASKGDAIKKKKKSFNFSDYTEKSKDRGKDGYETDSEVELEDTPSQSEDEEEEEVMEETSSAETAAKSDEDSVCAPTEVEEEDEEEDVMEAETGEQEVEEDEAYDKWLAENAVTYSKKEDKIFDRNYKDMVAKLQTNMLRCTGCNEQVNHKMHSLVFTHPLLGVLICKRCRKFYGKGTFKKDDEGLDEYCRWCANGGELMLCDVCTNGFCKPCLRRNMGRTAIRDIERSKEWRCYVCDMTPLTDVRLQHRVVLYNLTNIREKSLGKSRAERAKNELNCKFAGLKARRNEKGLVTPEKKAPVTAKPKTKSQSEVSSQEFSGEASTTGDTAPWLSTSLKDLKDMLAVCSSQVDRVQSKWQEVANSASDATRLQCSRRLLRLMRAMSDNFVAVENKFLANCGSDQQELAEVLLSLAPEQREVEVKYKTSAIQDGKDPGVSDQDGNDGADDKEENPDPPLEEMEVEENASVQHSSPKQSKKCKITEVCKDPKADVSDSDEEDETQKRCLRKRNDPSKDSKKVVDREEEEEEKEKEEEEEKEKRRSRHKKRDRSKGKTRLTRSRKERDNSEEFSDRSDKIMTKEEISDNDDNAKEHEEVAVANEDSDVSEGNGAQDLALQQSDESDADLPENITKSVEDEPSKEKENTGNANSSDAEDDSVEERGEKLGKRQRKADKNDESKVEEDSTTDKKVNDTESDEEKSDKKESQEKKNEEKSDKKLNRNKKDEEKSVKKVNQDKNEEEMSDAKVSGSENDEKPERKVNRNKKDEEKSGKKVSQDKNEEEMSDAKVSGSENDHEKSDDDSADVKADNVESDELANNSMLDACKSDNDDEPDIDSTKISDKTKGDSTKKSDKTKGSSVKQSPASDSDDGNLGLRRSNRTASKEEKKYVDSDKESKRDTRKRKRSSATDDTHNNERVETSRKRTRKAKEEKTNDEECDADSESDADEKREKKTPRKSKKKRDMKRGEAGASDLDEEEDDEEEPRQSSRVRRRRRSGEDERKSKRGKKKDKYADVDSDEYERKKKAFLKRETKKKKEHEDSSCEDKNSEADADEGGDAEGKEEASPGAAVNEKDSSKEASGEEQDTRNRMSGEDEAATNSQTDGGELPMSDDVSGKIIDENLPKSNDESQSDTLRLSDDVGEKSDNDRTNSSEKSNKKNSSNEKPKKSSRRSTNSVEKNTQQPDANSPAASENEMSNDVPSPKKQHVSDEEVEEGETVKKDEAPESKGKSSINGEARATLLMDSDDEEMVADASKKKAKSKAVKDNDAAKKELLDSDSDEVMKDILTSINGKIKKKLKKKGSSNEVKDELTESDDSDALLSPEVSKTRSNDGDVDAHATKTQKKSLSDDEDSVPPAATELKTKKKRNKKEKTANDAALDDLLKSDSDSSDSEKDKKSAFDKMFKGVTVKSNRKAGPKCSKKRNQGKDSSRCTSPNSREKHQLEKQKPVVEVAELHPILLETLKKDESVSVEECEKYMKKAKKGKAGSSALESSSDSDSGRKTKKKEEDDSDAEFKALMKFKLKKKLSQKSSAESEDIESENDDKNDNEEGEKEDKSNKSDEETKGEQKKGKKGGTKKAVKEGLLDISLHEEGEDEDGEEDENESKDGVKKNKKEVQSVGVSLNEKMKKTILMSSDEDDAARGDSSEDAATKRDREIIEEQKKKKYEKMKERQKEKELKERLAEEKEESENKDKDGSDSDKEIKKSVAKKGYMSLKFSSDEDEENEKKDQKNDHQDDDEEDSSDSEDESPRKSRMFINSDSDFELFEPANKKRKNMDSYSESDESSGDKKKKRKRVRKTMSSSSEEDAAQDEKAAEEETPSKRKVRRIIKDADLTESTKNATQQEEDRRSRIKERQQLYNKIFEINVEADQGDATKLVLDFDPKTKEELISVHEKLVPMLKPHQMQGIKFMWDATCESMERVKRESGSGAILAHCMGLGKTLQVIVFLHTLLTSRHLRKDISRVLVLCPVNTVYNWVSEFKKWLKGKLLPFDVIELISAKDLWNRAYRLDEWHKESGVCIMGYDMFRTLSNEKHKKYKGKMKEIFQKTLVNPGPDFVVCDEGHILKNEKSAISLAVNKMKTLRRVVLTGTPLQNNLKEYHCMIQFVKPNLLGTRKEFLNRFVNPISAGSCADATPRDVKRMKRRAHILHNLLEGCVQRFDYTVLKPFLPPKMEYVISVQMSELQCKLYSYYLDHLAQGGPKRSGSGLFVDFNNLSRVWTHPMVLALQTRRALLDDDEDELDDFICDDSTSESSEDERSSRRKKKKKKNDQESEDEVASKPSSPENELPDGLTTSGKVRSDWWKKIVGSSVESDDLSEDEWMSKIELSGKLVLLLNIMRECSCIGDKVLVFSQSILALDMIEEFLALIDQGELEMPSHEDALPLQYKHWKREKDYLRLDGSVSADTRKAQCKFFNERDNDRCRLFLISTRAGGIGINLVAANRVIIFDSSWNPAHDTQSIFRVYRFGQTKPSYIYRFVAQGTMEEKIYSRQVTKISTSLRVVDEHQIKRYFNTTDLADLYEFNPADQEIRDTPIVPEDRLLAELIIHHKKWIVGYHEHDSLLENQTSEELSEEERKAAWEDFENEKKGLVPQFNNRSVINYGNSNMPFPTSIPPFDINQVIQSIYSQNPNLTPSQLQENVVMATRQIQKIHLNHYQRVRTYVYSLKNPLLAPEVRAQMPYGNQDDILPLLESQLAVLEDNVKRENLVINQMQPTKAPTTSQLVAAGIAYGSPVMSGRSGPAAASMSKNLSLSTKAEQYIDRSKVIQANIMQRPSNMVTPSMGTAHLGGAVASTSREGGSSKNQMIQAAQLARKAHKMQKKANTDGAEIVTLE